MALSFYDSSIASYVQILGGVNVALEKARAMAEVGDLDLEALINFKLHEDMLPLSFQVISVWHHSYGAMRGLAEGLFEPPPNLGELDFAALQGLVEQATDFCKNSDPAEVEALSGRPMLFRMGKTELPFTTDTFLMSFSLPNFYFHATSTYCILRHHGVPLGKLDYLGRLRMTT